MKAKEEKKSTADNFTDHYSTDYELLEREFLDTLPYLTLDVDNRNAFSHAYIKIILQAGSMIDNVMREYCNVLDVRFEEKLREKKKKKDSEKVYPNIHDYKDTIKDYVPGFSQQEILLTRCMLHIKPWSTWEKDKSPFWWTVYSKIKHERFDYSLFELLKHTCKDKKRINYKFANQKYTIYALGGLYQTLAYAHQHLLKADGNDLVTEMPDGKFILTPPFKSELFEPSEWSNKMKFSDLICGEFTREKWDIPAPPLISNLCNETYPKPAGNQF